eukprot:gene12914-biopygen3504
MVLILMIFYRILLLRLLDEGGAGVHPKSMDDVLQERLPLSQLVEVQFFEMVLLDAHHVRHLATKHFEKKTETL